jgi:hypothetical protein
LDIKGGVEAPPIKEDNTTPIDMRNTRIHDVRLLSSRRPEPV